MGTHRLQDLNRLGLGIKMYQAQLEEQEKYRQVLDDERGKRNPNVIDMHIRGCENRMEYIRRRLAALEHEAEVINREMLLRLQRKMTRSVVATPTAKTVMDLDRKPPQKKPGRKYVEKGERRPEAGKKSKDRNKGKKGRRGSQATA